VDGNPRRAGQTRRIASGDHRIAHRDGQIALHDVAGLKNRETRGFSREIPGAKASGLKSLPRKSCGEVSPARFILQNHMPQNRGSHD